MAKKSKKLGSKEKLAIKELTEAGLLEPLVRSMMNTTNTGAPRNPTIPHQYPWLDYEVIEDEKYEGEWKDGKKHGQGTQTWSNGEKYVGEFKNGQVHGYGTRTFPNGKKYVGEWKDGKQNGQGTYTYSNGDKYVGEFKDGKFNGQGTFNISDGKKYVGEYKDGKKHGQGTYTYSNGDKYVGEFKEGWEWKGTEYNQEGNIIGKLVNGEPQ